MSSRARAVLAIAATALLATTVGCSGSKGTVRRVDEIPNVGVVEDQGQAPHQGGRLTYGIASDPQGWNPAVDTWDPAGAQVARTLFDTLTTFDEHGEAAPDLAASLTHNEDYTSWTIELRGGVRLHNGRVLDAAVVADNLEIYRNSPLTASMLSAVTQITVSGDLEVTVDTSRPWVALPEVLTGRAGMVADPEWLASGDPARPVGTGPFRLESWVPGDVVRVERSPDWWRSDEHGIGLPYLDGIEFRVVPNEEVRTAMIESGRLDMMQTSSGDKITRFKIRDDIEAGHDRGESDPDRRRSATILGDGTFQVFTSAPGESPETFIQLNTATTPFVDIRVRELLEASTDPVSFTESIERDLYEPASGPFAESSPWYHDTGGMRYDADHARELAAQMAGHPVGKADDTPVVTFSILIPTDTHLLDGARHLQQRWAAFGIAAVIDMVEPQEFDRRVSTGDYQAAICTGYDSPDPILDIASWNQAASAPLGQPALNSARIADPNISQEIDQASSTADGEIRMQIYGSVQERLARDVPFVWLFHGIRAVIASKNLVNVVNHVLPDGTKGMGLTGGTHPMHQIWVKA